MSTALTVQRQAPLSVFSGDDAFSSAQRICKALVSSDLVPEAYRGENRLGNALIALDVANRMEISPLMVMQNLHIIEGRPSWASNFIIAALNACGIFSPIRFRVTDLGPREVSYEVWDGPKGNRTKVKRTAKIHDKEFVAYAIEKSTGEVLEGPPVTLGMAVTEGWYYRSGSKWQSMPDLMGRYRAAAFFGRLYAPHILNGLPTADETADIVATEVEAKPAAASGEATPLVPVEEKPAGRAKGMHAALKNAEAAKEAKAPAQEKGAPEKKPAPKREEAPASAAKAQSDIIDADFSEDPSGGLAHHDDVFDAPGEDGNYSPD